MSNPFRNPLKRKQFDSLLVAFENKNKILFTRDGLPNHGNSFAAHFWAGHDGINGGRFRPNDPQYRAVPSYVFYRAGQECAK